MAMFENDPVRIRYDLEGDGFPVLLIAPGGMGSENERWNGMPWNPREALADQYQLVGMDQRNAGGSFAPVSGSDSWFTYVEDQLALLDHLGIAECHVVGMCIGGPYIMGLLGAAPERFRSAVLLQPVGIDDNRHAFIELFDQWSSNIESSHPEAADEDWAEFRQNMWSGEFVLTATRDEVRACQTPLLVMMGNDLYHPQSTSREIAALAPNASFVERWKGDEDLSETNRVITDFLRQHTGQFLDSE